MGQIGADEDVVPGGRQSRNRGADVGRSRADEDVVPDGRLSCSREQTWVGARQTKTVAGEGTGTQTETGADVTQGLDRD